MPAFNLGEFEDMKKVAEFGLAVLELAKEAGLVPKRPKARVITKTQTKIVYRRPRRTKAEMAAAGGDEAPAAE